MGRIAICLLVAFSLWVVPAAHATDENPAVPVLADEWLGFAAGQRALTGYDNHGAWAAMAGTTTLIDFEAFADGTLITTELTPYGIGMVSGTTSHSGPCSQFVTASTSLPFPMFTAGTLPSEPNFFSNDLSYPYYGNGSITLELTGSTTAIGSFVADGAPLDNFNIEVFVGATSLGVITVAPRTLPDSFVGVISDTPFNKATFFASYANDAWGLDNLELRQVVTPVNTRTWGAIKQLFR